MEMGIARVPTMTVGMSNPRFATDLVRMAEDLGCESLWCVEHVLVPETYASRYPFDPSGKMPLDPRADLPDMIVWLTYAAAKSTTLRLATGVLVLPLRNPAVLAKQLATLHELSEGRLMLGVGVGWLEEEFAAVGAPFGERGRRTDEYLDVMRTLWEHAPASFHGSTIDFEHFYSCPQPGRQGIPIFIGGSGRAAARRAVARGDGVYLVVPNAASLRDEVALLREEADRAGRDFGELEISVPAPQTLDEASEYQTIGATRLIVPLFQDTIAECASAVETFQREILAHLA